MRKNGFSIIELLIVLVIIAILLLVALPRYGASGAKVKRQDAYSALTQLAFEQERFYTQNNTYTINVTALNPIYVASNNTFNTNERGESNYNITVTQADASGYTLQATAIDTQTRDSVSQFTINNLGQQTRTLRDSGVVENKWQ